MSTAGPTPTRRLLSSLAYSALISVVAGLGYLTFVSTNHPNQEAEGSGESTQAGTLALVESDSFSPRHEKSSDMERLNVSVQLRINAPGSMDAWVFVVARNDQVSPRVWAAWPQGAHAAITTGGHFRGSTPGAGYQATLTSSWTRIHASIDHPPGTAPFDTVMIYVVNAKGQIVLARPYPLP